MLLPLLLAISVPRLTLGAMWLLGERVENVFGDDRFWPVLGLALFPWATIMYVVLWVEGEGLTSGQWVLVGVAGFADAVSWFARVPQRQHRYP